MAAGQCGLCLSCGAPFPPKPNEIVLFNRLGNMSTLYAHTCFVESPSMNRKYKNPVLMGVYQNSHMVHGSHHETALKYMCYHFKGDRAPVRHAGNRPVDGDSCMFLFFKASSTNQSPQAACWARPVQAKRVNFSSLVDHMKAVDLYDRDADFALSFNLMYPTCVPCNSLMTALSKMRYILGLESVSLNNAYGCVIPHTEKPIETVAANPHKCTNLDNAYGIWTIPAGSVYGSIPAQATGDPLAPIVAYYLHLCLPHTGGHPDTDVFDIPALHGSKVAARRLFFELSWIILEIACLGTLIVDGKADGENFSHGLHQHYGVLDLYVSFFLWRLLQFEYPEEILSSKLDFPQWHQKYYCVALGCQDLGVDMSLTILGLKVIGNVAVGAKTLLTQICDNLLNLYTGELALLIKFVTNNLPAPGAVPAPSVEELAVSRYFLPLRYMARLRLDCVAKVCGLVRLFCVFH